MKGRFSSIILVAATVTAVFFVVFSSVPASAASRTWTSDTDFAGGTFLSTEVTGAGNAASVTLAVDPQQDWINMNPTGPPSARRGIGFTFDEGNGVALAFGGLRSDNSYSNELWTYNAGTNAWLNITPTTSPPGRWKPGLSYDPIEQLVVLYGGADAGGPRTDLWEYDIAAATWSQITPAPPSPRPLSSTPMAYDSTADGHILAGRDPSGGDFETWVYDAASDTWTDRTTATAPEPREGHSLTFDRITLRSILFGGADGLTVYGDVWEYNHTTNGWVKTIDHIPNQTPNKRTDHAMAFGPNGAVSLMFGGFDDSAAYPPESWYYVSPVVLWSDAFAGTAPGGRKDHAFAWDSARDVVVMYGGLLAGGSVTDQTWIWGRGYYNGGSYESPVFDAGCTTPDWVDLWFNRTTPATTTARFQLATSTSATGPWAFVGGNGLPGTYYDTTGTATWAGHDGQQFFRWRAALTTGDVKVTPEVNDISVNYVCAADPPEIVTTNPADGATGVGLTANIVVTFSEAMNQGTVQWLFSDPGITFTDSWDATSRVLTLSHSTPFAECTLYTMEITQGRDQNDDLDLVPGLAPNPWSFTSVCINPFIVSTDPAGGETGVGLTAPIVITFSEPMNRTSVTYTFSDPGIAFTRGWSAGDTVLTLTHGTSFAPCTSYTMDVTAGLDLQGLPLGPGPVPNPWSFTSSCPQSAPPDLAVNLMVPDVVLSWGSTGAPMYNVYSSQDRFATFPSGWTLLGSPASTTFLATGQGSDGLTHYYLVRSTDGTSESPNSTMGAKTELTFTYSAARTNIVWISLPYRSGYTQASDIANALTSTRIDVVGKWDPAKQSSTTYFFSRGRWRGTDFAINSGDGLFLGVRQTFSWAVAGTDRSVSLTFFLNGGGRPNVNWISVPYTGTYNSASDIANELTSTKITEVGLWDPATQTSTRWFWSGTAWTGTDFAVAPGSGLYVIVASSFTWTPALITPTVP